MKTMKKLTYLLLAFAMLLILSPVFGGTAKAEIVNDVTYIDADGTTKSHNPVTVVTSGMEEFGVAGTETWYVVDADLNRSGFKIKGDVHLILTDGKTLSSGGAVYISEDSSLTVYGQAGGSGTLDISGTNDALCDDGGTNENRSLTVNGGKVTVKGGSDENGYGYIGLYHIFHITVNGGSLTAIGGNGGGSTGNSHGGDGIYVTTDITVNGGSFTAIGGNSVHGPAGDGICDSTNITVNGGSLTAIGGDGVPYENHPLGDGCGIDSDAITVNGGSLTATGGGVGIAALDVKELTIKSGLTYYDAANGYAAFTSYSNQHSISLTLPLTTWSQLYDALQAGGVAFLGADVTCGTGDGAHASSGPLTVPSGKTVTLNLNGHVVNRNMSSADSYGEIIDVEGGSLTLMDSDPTAAHSNSSLPSGGVITGGNGINYGGGVYVDNGTFVMNGGTIFGNSAYSGGGVNMYRGTFTMNGGTIHSNRATTSYGGGVYTNGGTFNMNGGVITNNTTSDGGGGVHTGGTFNVSGSPQITGNTKGAAENNVYVSDSGDGKITVAGALTPYNANVGTGAYIGISLWSNSGGYTFTQGGAVSFTSDTEVQKYFFADNSTGYYVTTDNGQARLSPNGATAPTITTQPASPAAPLAYGYASSDVILTFGVTAAMDASYGLSYQWYKGDNENLALSNDTKISGATSASYAVPTGLSVGTYYYKCVATATRTDNGQSASMTSAAAAVQVGWSVGVTAGADMTLSSGEETQTVTNGSAMTNVVYSANNGYYFPMDYSASSNGVSAVWNSYTQITVSGTPTANTTITLTAPTAKTKETTPNATFTATGAETGTLSDVTSEMKYMIDSGDWQNITGTNVTLNELSACTINVYQPGNGTTTTDSDVQAITVTKAGTPNLTVTQPSAINGKGSIASTMAHEYSSDNGTSWTTCTANQELEAGSYFVRVKAAGAVLASGNQEVTVTAFSGTQETAPNATFTATGAETGTLSNVTSGMKYKIDSGTWQDITGASVLLTGLSACTIKVYQPGNGTTTTDSAEQTISVTKAEMPTTAGKVDCTTADNNDGKLTGVTTAMEYKKSDDGNWGGGTGNDITGLEPGTYYVRVKVVSTTLASDNQELTIMGKVANPTYSPAGGKYSEAQNVTIGCTTSNATIYYTTDGSEPTTISSVYSGAIAVSETTTIKAIAVKEGMTDSYVTSAEYLFPYRLLYNPGEGGSGSMNPETVYLGDKVILPDCSFIAPADCKFNKWQISGVDGIFDPGYEFTVVKNSIQENVITVTASWESVSPATILSAPEPRNPTYTGSAQELVTAGIATGGTMNYAIGNNSTTAPTTGWSTSIPTGTEAGTYYVWFKAKGDDDHSDTDPACLSVTIAPKPQDPTPQDPTPQDPAPKDETVQVDAGLRLNSEFLVSWKDSTVNVCWGAVPGADTFEVWAEYCGKQKCKKVVTVQNVNSVTLTKLHGKKLNPKRCVKVYVVAYINGVRLGRTIMAYSAGGKYGCTNAKELKVSKSTYNLKVGKSAKIKVSTVKMKSSKKLLGKSHKCPIYRYASSNKNVATVNENGRIKAVAAGVCDVWVYAQNGLSKKVVVTVQ